MLIFDHSDHSRKSHLISMLKKIQILLMILSFILPAIPVLAVNGPVLEKMNRIDEQDNILLYLNFSKLPQYDISINGRRIDLSLAETKAQPDLSMIEEDDRIIKVLKNDKDSRLQFSFFLRYPPQNIDTRELQDSNRLLLNILLGNPFTKHYQNFASELNDITIMKGQLKDYSNPASLSPYPGNWLKFFKEYEAQIPLHIQPKYTLPPFPLSQFFTRLRLKKSSIPAEIQDLASQRKWDQVQSRLREILQEEPEGTNRQILILAYAEAHIRNDDYRQASRMLSHLDRIYPESAVTPATAFLRIYLQAITEDPYPALLELGKMETELSRENLLLPYVTLFQAELALASNRADRAEQILKRDDAAYDTTTAKLRLIRQADTYYSQNKTIKALVVYQMTAKESTLATLPFSLANFADTLYHHKLYKKASIRYKQLADLLTEKKQQDLVLYKQAMSELHHRNPAKVLHSFLQVEEGFPETRGAYQSRLKQIDINYLRGKLQSVGAVRQYDRLAQDANWREIREEAAFKQILVLHLNNENRRAMDLLMIFLRDFRSGNLITDARALVIDILPLVIKDMIAKEDYLQALILAKKNKSFFVHRWIDNSILNELATAYLKLGFYDRAEKVYRFMLEMAPEEQLEDIYIHLLTTLYSEKKYALIEEYTDRFFLRFPDSKQRETVFLIKLKALQHQGRLADAATLLTDEERPITADINKTGGTILFDLKRYEEVIKILTPQLEQEGDQSEGDVIYQMAESYFQTENYSQAIPLFTRLMTTDAFQDQARYRLAQMSIASNNRDNALNLFKQLAEKGNSPLWKKLAREELEILQLKNMNL